MGYKSWFDLMSKKPCQRVVFGHWAMLRAKTNNENFINIDAGCIYGGRLVALHLEDNKYFYVNINGRVLGC